MCVDVHVYTLHVCTCAYVHICTHIHLCYMYGGTSVGMALDWMGIAALRRGSSPPKTSHFGHQRAAESRRRCHALIADTRALIHPYLRARTRHRTAGVSISDAKDRCKFSKQYPRSNIYV